MFSEFVIRSAICFLILCFVLFANSRANETETCSSKLSNGESVLRTFDSNFFVDVMSAIPQNDTPILAVLGKTRAGKGELIRTAIRFLTGQELDIASSGMLSHTRTAKGYPTSFHGTEIMFYDTVGFGDSDCTNLAEETLLRMLEATGTQPFYPPLYVLKDLDSTNIDALRKLTSIFPEVCVAVRGGDEMFNSAARDFAAVELQISQIFHLPEFVSAAPQTRELYDNAVNDTLAAYASFTATRKDLKFDSEHFVGQVEKVKVNSETKYEDVVTEEGYTATETQITIKERVESVLTGYRTEKRSRDVSTRDLYLRVLLTTFMCRCFPILDMASKIRKFKFQSIHLLP